MWFEPFTTPCRAALDRMAVLDPDLDAAKQSIYDFFGAREDDRFVFTSSGAEAINQVHWSVFLEIARKEGKCHFVTSSVEDAPVMQSFKRLEELGCFVKIAPVLPSGQIDLGKLAELVGPKTALISLSHSQGLTGVLQPVEEVAALAKAKGCLLHVDASYSIGKVPVTLDADYLTFSGDTIHSVKGSGGLFAKKEAPLVPLILGGSGLRGGPFDAPSFMALTASLQQAALYQDALSLEGARLRSLLEQTAGGRPLFQDVPRLPNVAVLAFPGAHNEALHYYLQRKGIYCSIGGSYCQHLARLANETAVSFTLSRMTTEEEVLKTSDIIRQTVKHLQSISVGVCT